MNALGLRIKETKEVYEGEVTEITPNETENPLGGYTKTIANVVVGLKTTKGTKQLRLDPSIYESLQKEKVTVGDVIYIEANTGAVKVPCQHFFVTLQRELGGRMPTLRNTILKLRSTSRFPREMCTRRRKLCRT